jgi:hypothetical protein
MLAALTARSAGPPATPGAPTDALHHHQPPKFRPTPSNSGGTRPIFGVLVRTRWRRDRLDEELARGAYPATCGELSLRAAHSPQLVVFAYETGLALAPPTLKHPIADHGRR